MKYLGCAYYPEYWGRERFGTDAKLMREAGINIVRIGEFAWSRMEPEEGVFTLEWLHECIQILGRYGIDVILCTPTATPPAWMTFTYPDTLLMKADGKRLEHGGRRHYCYSSDTFRRHAERIVEKLSTEFSGYENVVAWQIDNEPDLCESDLCYCESCQGKFQAWLKQKYGSVEELNREWATGFWSMDYSDWRQVRLAELGKHHYSSRKLDTKRFVSHMLSDFILQQGRIIKKNHPDSIVSTNLNGAVFTDLDYYKIFDEMDVAFKDLYFDICTMDTNALIMNQFRSFKPGKKYWITETGAGAIDFGRPAHKGQFKAWLWSSYAHGGDAHVVFRWRTCLSGQEQELQGMLEHSGHPGHRYKAIQEAFLEMRELSGKLGELPLPAAEVAIVHDYDVMWGYQSSVIKSEIDYEKNLVGLHQELYRRNVLSDIIPKDRDLGPYKLLILPSMMIVEESFAERLKAYVMQGGIVLAQGQLGMRDANDNYLKVRGPEHLQNFFGILISGGMYLYSQVAPDEAWFKHKRYFEVALDGSLGGETVKGKASTWLGDLELNGADVLLKVSEDTYEGQPAIVEKRNGRGTALYAAALRLDDGLMGALLDYSLDKAGIAYRKDIPEHVEVIRRGDVLFLVNHRYEEVRVTLDCRGEVIRGKVENGAVVLKPFEICIIRESQ